MAPLAAPAETAAAATDAFWALLKRILIAAACADLLLAGLFSALGETAVALIGLAGVVLYAVVYALAERGAYVAAAALLAAGVLARAVVGTLVAGWTAGFHHHLLVLVPAVLGTASPRRALAAMFVLLGIYLVLDLLAQFVGAFAPLRGLALVFARWFNLGVVFALFATLAHFHAERLRRAEQAARRPGSR